MIKIEPETRVKSCNSCGRSESGKDHTDTGYKTILIKVGDNAGSNKIILCPKCFSLLGTYIETVLRDEDDTEIQKMTDFINDEEEW